MHVVPSCLNSELILTKTGSVIHTYWPCPHLCPCILNNVLFRLSQFFCNLGGWFISELASSLLPGWTTVWQKCTWVQCKGIQIRGHKRYIGSPETSLKSIYRQNLRDTLFDEFDKRARWNFRFWVWIQREKQFYSALRKRSVLSKQCLMAWTRHKFLVQGLASRALQRLDIFRISDLMRPPILEAVGQDKVW